MSIWGRVSQNSLPGVQNLQILGFFWQFALQRRETLDSAATKLTCTLYEAWLGLGTPTMYNRAREKVEEILAAPLVDPMPESVSRELDEILLAADKELAATD